MSHRRRSIHAPLKFGLSVLTLLASLALLVPSAFALFTNGNFETGDKAGWTSSNFTNNGLLGTAPFNGSSINQTTGGSRPLVELIGSAGGGPLNVADANAPALSAPRFGDFAVRVNALATDYGDKNAANTLTQQTTVTAADIDHSDSKVHIRFAFAPVLENPNPVHPDAEQPYFYIGIKNITKGNAPLFQNFNFSAQPGVAWQTSATGWLFTDWQLVDLAPGNGVLDVGDTIEFQVIAAGCSQGAHGGYVYVDAFGAFFPDGLSVVSSAPLVVTAGQPLTYNVTYHNNDVVDFAGTVVTFNTPPNTTFASVSNPAVCTTTPAVGAAGLVSCAVGTVVAGSSTTFQVVVTVNSSASGTITSGSYGLSAPSFAPILGVAVNTAVVNTATNAYLSALSTSVGTLLPAFDPSILVYQVNAPAGTTTVTPTLSEPTATVTVNGNATTSASASLPITLPAGTTTSITVVVTAADGVTVKTYTINVVTPVEVPADLEVTQTSSTINLSQLILTITVRNKGPNAVTGAVLSDTFPTAATGKTWTWTCAGTACPAASGTGNLSATNATLGTLSLNGTVVLTVTGTLANWSHWSNTASLAVPTGITDSVTPNNSSTIGRYMILLPIVYK